MFTIIEEMPVDVPNRLVFLAAYVLTLKGVGIVIFTSDHAVSGAPFAQGAVQKDQRPRRPKVQFNKSSARSDRRCSL